MLIDIIDHLKDIPKEYLINSEKSGRISEQTE